MLQVALGRIEVNRVRAQEEGMGCTQRETRSPVQCESKADGV
jgi:hypothetical protein